MDEKRKLEEKELDTINGGIDKENSRFIDSALTSESATATLESTSTSSEYTIGVFGRRGEDL